MSNLKGNQWCMSQKTSSSITNIDMQSCTDSCIPVDTQEMVVKCCQTSNCNTPFNQNVLSCIKSSRLDDFTPATVTCNTKYS